MKRALVLSGGGARGAYEAGVLTGLRDVLAQKMRAPLFHVITGTSVGAMNAVHVASHIEDLDRGLRHLVELWTSLRVETHVRPHLSALATRRSQARDGLHLGRALLDATPFEQLVTHDVSWTDLHDVIRRGILDAVIVSALNVANGRTASFIEARPGHVYVPSRDASRTASPALLTPAHVLASAAIPLLFPARRIGRSYFCDGGLRFNTPISPALRAGADRLVVIALRAGQTATGESEAIDQYPNPIFLLGKVLDALLLDPIEHDLLVLERLNDLVDVLEGELDAPALARVGDVLEANRGLSYRRVQTLVFRPSEDIGVLALDHLRRDRTRLCRPGAAATMLLERLAALGTHVEADVLSYLLFDGQFARTLVELGRRDVLARTDEVRAFFDVEEHRHRSSSEMHNLHRRERFAHVR